MSSSNSSSRSHTGRQTTGIPKRCWCGADVTTFGAQTKENLFRRFYRCEIGLKRKNEHHLFKWVDEAILDEVTIVDEKHSQLQVDVDSFKMQTARRFENQAKQIDQTIQQIKLLIAENTENSKTKENSTLTTEDTLASATMAYGGSHPLTNIAAAAFALGAMAWIYSRIAN
ncbi:uncharacterized protein At4g04775-like [Raphanus sativus]|uniref:Uncharacterized protein At4g04775-like n=1 Tax=Raphanus sativus TaxID=3726 RepID=A0A6J0LIX9_RAPSA|nr:uncharacterized protein At4g04775-like [Raphanus sativus]